MDSGITEAVPPNRRYGDRSLRFGRDFRLCGGLFLGNVHNNNHTVEQLVRLLCGKDIHLFRIFPRNICPVGVIRTLLPLDRVIQIFITDQCRL